jgi:hypothetical protein
VAESNPDAREEIARIECLKPAAARPDSSKFRFDYVTSVAISSDEHRLLAWQDSQR